MDMTWHLDAILKEGFDMAWVWQLEISYVYMINLTSFDVLKF